MDNSIPAELGDLNINWDSQAVVDRDAQAQLQPAITRPGRTQRRAGSDCEEQYKTQEIFLDLKYFSS